LENWLIKAFSSKTGIFIIGGVARRFDAFGKLLLFREVQDFGRIFEIKRESFASNEHLTDTFALG